MKKLKESEEGKRLRAQMRELGVADDMIWDDKDLTNKLDRRSRLYHLIMRFKKQKTNEQAQTHSV